MISATSSGKHIFAEQPFPNCYRFFCTFYDKFKTQKFFFHFIFRLFFADHNDPPEKLKDNKKYENERRISKTLMPYPMLKRPLIHRGDVMHFDGSSLI